MATDVGWILEALENNPAKTRAGMARALNVDKSAVTRLLNGDRQLKFHEAAKIAEYLGIAPPTPVALADRDRDFGGGDPSPAMASSPIYDARTLAEGRWMVFRTAPPIDFKTRAPNVANAARVFGFYAPDNAMAPRFKVGEVVWVDPSRPVSTGDDVLFGAADNGPDGETVLLAWLTETTDAHWIATQYGRDQTHMLERSEWSALLALPRY